MTIFDKADDIISFCESGNLCDYDFSMLPMKSVSHLYRGIMFPKEWLTIDNTIHEWSNGCTHWTTSIETAIKFSHNEDGDGFVSDFGEERGITTFEECKKLFAPVVFYIETPQETYPLCEWLYSLLEKDYHVDENYMYEKEYTVTGYDFRIKKIRQEDIFYVEVEPLKTLV